MNINEFFLCRIDLAHLVLYNMTLTYGKKYFILEDDILPFLSEKWNHLQVDHVSYSSDCEEQGSANYGLRVKSFPTMSRIRPAKSVEDRAQKRQCAIFARRLVTHVCNPYFNYQIPKHASPPENL